VTDLTYWRDLQRLADFAARRFKLGKVVVRPITDPRTQFMGICGPDGVIELRVHQLHHPNRPLKWSTLVHYLCHELAHLYKRRPGRRTGLVLNHGPHHAKTMLEIKQFWSTHRAAKTLAP